MITKERLNRQEVLVLLVLAGILAYTTFQWGGVVRTGRYQYLLVLGPLAMLLSLGRSREEWAPIPGRVVRYGIGPLRANALGSLLTAMSRAVVHDPKNAARRLVRLLGHDFGHEAVGRGDSVFLLAAAE